jgi:hypothetical protein
MFATVRKGFVLKRICHPGSDNSLLTYQFHITSLELKKIDGMSLEKASGRTRRGGCIDPAPPREGKRKASIANATTENAKYTNIVRNPELDPLSHVSQVLRPSKDLFDHESPGKRRIQISAKRNSANYRSRLLKTRQQGLKGFIPLNSNESCPCHA